ncbi:MAG TPA: TonB-dependent receptor [Bryobacteraceae bacterium]|nr:TonB-dependent receptor [Bryobacteraceae bacterium]
MLKRISAIALLATAIVWGQASTSLRGTIKDPSGAVVSDAAVSLTDAATGSLRKVVTDASGSYQFLQLAPGDYSVKVEKPGFTTSVKDGVRLEVNTPATFDLQLSVGAVGSTVNVEAEVSSINTVDGSVGNAFTEKQINELPLQTRNVVELLSVQPGVTQTGEVLGARRDQNNITLDGVDVNNNQNAGITTASTNGSAPGGTNFQGTQVPVIAGFNAAIPVPLDSVEEFRVTVGGQGADQGRSSGGQVVLVTKSGTNVVHGTAYEYNRNTALAANDFFSNQAGIPRAALVRNQFGVSLGGPVKKNRLFLFGNWERRIDRSSAAVTSNVPSAALKQGILTVALSNGQTLQLNPTQVAAIDPLHIGVNPLVLQYLQALPSGNNPQLGLDAGLNYSVLRFNAPQDLDNAAYVAKMDFNIDSARKHTLSVRGSLNDAASTLVAAQYPGGNPSESLVDNSKGIAGTYTWVINPNMINVATVGDTRLGLNYTGAVGTALTFQQITPPTNFTYRPSIQLMPTYNALDNFTWIKGKHTITMGADIRFIRNARNSYANSFPSYSFSRNTLGGLGGDAATAVTSYVNTLLGTTGVTLKQPTAVEDGLGDLLGLINQYTANYLYDKTGARIPFGTPAAREYAVNDYEGFVMDSWRFRKDLTFTVGLRYSNSSTPWETHGTEVVTTVPLQTYFAERVAAAASGTPNYLIKDASLTYTLGGAANNAPGWYDRSNLNFGPRASFAWSPDSLSFLGKGNVMRGGFAMVYDQYGSDMVYNIDLSGSPGLATNVTQPVNTNFTNSPRYAGINSLPALPGAPQGGFPFTPATITGGFNEGVGVVSNLKAPYSLVFNYTWAKQLPGKLTFEGGYAGRLYRRGLLEQDFDQPLTTFKDPTSGTTWAQAVGVLHQDYIAAGQTYGPIAPVPFIEDMFPALKNAYVTGSATQNYYQSWIVQNGLSDLDNLNQMDRQRISGTNTCYSRTGCNTFYPNQQAGLPTWTNAGYSNYNAAIFTLRRPLSNGVAFDFNYTWSHSIDNSSGAESGAGQGGAILQDAFNVNAFRGSSDFDQRHNITADVLYELPFGKGKKYLTNAGNIADEFIGGWQIAVIGRYHSGTPATISSNGAYPTNYEYSALADLLPGATNSYGSFINNNGLPSLFTNTSAYQNYVQQAGGATGTRAIVRLPGFSNIDVSFSKSFRMPFEGHKLQFRAEMFNALNHVNFYAPVLDINSTSTFGQFQKDISPRVVQASLRYAF